MKILIITGDDPVFTPIFFKTFFKIFNNKNKISKIIICKSKNRISIYNTYIVFGIKGLLIIGLEYIINLLKSIIGNIIKNTNLCNTTQSILNYYNIKYHIIDDINDRQLLTEAKNCDILISISFPFKVRNELLKLPKYGCINLHNGKLPEYRGLFTTFWQILNNENNIEITIHKMEEELDKGKILAQKKIPYDKNVTLYKILKITRSEGAILLNEFLNSYKLEDILKENNNFTKYSNSNYYKFPTKKDIKLFKSRGFKII